MMQYVLVHGAWHGGWCWSPLATLLLQRGHKVSCPDLPGHGASPVSLSDVTYDLYYQSLVNELATYQEPVIFVAHSMSGILAAPLLDQYPEKIAHLYLISAFVAQQGQSLLDVAMQGGPSEIPQMLIMDEKNKTQSLDLRKAKKAFYHDCSDEIAEWAMKQLQPQPTAPFKKAIQWSDSGKTRNKRTYIICENDRDVHPTTQRQILAHYPCREIYLKSGHFPFFSHAEELVEILTHSII